MSGLTPEEMTGWRNKIKNEASFWNIKVISQTDYFMTGDDWHDVSKASFVFDTYWVKKCDAVVACLNAPKSIGTAQEIMLAYEHNKPIIMIANKDKWENEVNPWLKYEATEVFFYEDYEDEIDLYGDVVDYLRMYE